MLRLVCFTRFEGPCEVLGQLVELRGQWQIISSSSARYFGRLLAGWLLADWLAAWPLRLFEGFLDFVKFFNGVIP